MLSCFSSCSSGVWSPEAPGRRLPPREADRVGPRAGGKPADYFDTAHKVLPAVCHAIQFPDGLLVLQHLVKSLARLHARLVPSLTAASERSGSRALGGPGA